MNIKKEININKKIILMLLFINIFIIVIGTSYALFEVKIIQNSVVKIQVGTTNITTIVEGYNDNLITLNSGESKTLNITLSNITDYDILYKMYYTVESGSGEITVDEISSDSSGTMNSTKSLTFTITNENTSAITIKIGTYGALINSSITLGEGEYEFIIDKEPPIISISVNNNYTLSPTMTINSNESGTYCVNTSNIVDDMTNCIFSGNITSDISITTSTLTSTATYYVHVQDKYENIGISTGVNVNVGNPFGLWLKNNVFSTATSYNGLYRYIGWSVNNYVKLGNVLYRIIGVTSQSNTTLGLSAYQVKLIKDEKLDSTMNWYFGTNVEVRWNVSGYTVPTIYTNLQGNSVLGNTNIIPSGWSDKISSVKWYVGDVSSTTSWVSTVVQEETSLVSQSKSKIGLMYLSDYYYAYKETTYMDCYNDGCKSWMTKYIYEWTMTRHRYAQNGGGNYAWNIDSDAMINPVGTGNAYSVRPVFYLSTAVQYKSGNGSYDNPYIIF